MYLLLPLPLFSTPLFFTITKALGGRQKGEKVLKQTREANRLILYEGKAIK